jgi:hypothetical protein
LYIIRARTAWGILPGKYNAKARAGFIVAQDSEKAVYDFEVKKKLN